MDDAEDELDVVEDAEDAEEDDALLSELDPLELLPAGVLSLPPQAPMALAHDIAPVTKKSQAFPCFMKEPPRRVTQGYIIRDGRCRGFFGISCAAERRCWV